MSLPEYDQLQAALGDEASGRAAAEAHGTLCGLLCAGVDKLPDAWIRDTLADSAEYRFGGPADARTLLEALYEFTGSTLASGDMRFQPLLPDEGTRLEDRAVALGAWCGGFLYGLAARGLRPTEELPGQLHEILADLAEISRAGVAEEEAAEEGEAAYAELVEYLRVAVQLVYDTGRGIDPADRG